MKKENEIKLKIEQIEDDDSDFIALINKIISSHIKSYKSTEIYLFNIRDWFDYKWCYFSGKLIGAVGFSNFTGMTLPPFVPNRVISQKYYLKQTDNPLSYKISTAKTIQKKQSSNKNIERLIRDISNDGIFIWYSSSSRISKHGSLMIYSVQPKIKVGWHITFIKKDNWQIGKTSFISRKEVELLIGSH